MFDFQLFIEDSIYDIIGICYNVINRLSQLIIYNFKEQKLVACIIANNPSGSTNIGFANDASCIQHRLTVDIEGKKKEIFCYIYFSLAILNEK